MKDAQQIFDQIYLVDQKNEDPDQFRATIWVTAWKATKEEEQSYAENT